MSEAAAALLVALALAGGVAMLLLCVAVVVLLARLGRALIGTPKTPPAAPPPRRVASTVRLRVTRPVRRPSSHEALAVWRYRQLLQLEVDPLTAAQAALSGIDAASVRSLTELGCPTELALAIVAPDERGVPVGGAQPRS